jgi:hypothetical protein
MWIKLSSQFVNLSNIVRIEFVQQGPQEVAVVFSVKPSGSDKTVFEKPDDVLRIKEVLNSLVSA